jgi:hypothetical protein
VTGQKDLDTSKMSESSSEKYSTGRNS